MGSCNLSDTIVQECVAVMGTEIRRMGTVLESGSCREMERGVQQALLRVGGAIVSTAFRERAATMPRPVRCVDCGGRLRLVDPARTRVLSSLVGEITVERAVYVCQDCHQGWCPFDAELGLGRGTLTPGLACVACRFGVEESFEDAAEMLREGLGVDVPDGTLRRVCDTIGAVAEAAQQDLIETAVTGQAREDPDGVETVIIATDGVMVHVDGDWHEMKIGRAAPLGPDATYDARAKRPILTMGPSICGGGREPVERFRYRLHVLAVHAGLGQRTRRVVLVGDGARWIWKDVSAFFGGPARTVIEVVDIYHAYEHLWTLGHTVFADEAACIAWVETQKDTLYTQGPLPVLGALRTLWAQRPSDPSVRKAIRLAFGYFRRNRTRMDYPRFIAQHLPIGSGAIESLCKSLVEARVKQAGMRWSGAGLDAIIALRSLHRSGSWDVFWASEPLRTHERSHPHRRPLRRPAQAPLHSAHATQPMSTDPPSSSGHVTSPPKQTHPWRGPMILPRSA